MSSKPELGYWKIRGFAQPIRLLLAYLEIDYEDKFYTVGDAPDYDRSSWFDVKHTLGIDFPNLPYYIDGDLKIGQSGAIIKHLARKHGLNGKTEEEMIRIDVLEGVVGDISISFLTMCYFDYEGMKPKFMEALPKHLKAFSDYLATNKWFAGDDITYIDFKLYEQIHVLRTFAPGCLDDFQNLKDFLARFEALPAIAKYMGSPDYMHRPFNNKMAKFK